MGNNGRRSGGLLLLLFHVTPAAMRERTVAAMRKTRKNRRGFGVLLLCAVCVAALALVLNWYGMQKGVAPPTEAQRTKMVQLAEQWLGEPYRSAAFACPGIGPGLCSGFVRRVCMDALGEERGNFGRNTTEQRQELQDRASKVPPQGRFLVGAAIRHGGDGLLQAGDMQMRPGDLVYYKAIDSGAQHVGMYIGDQDGKPYMIDNNESHNGVTKRPLVYDPGTKEVPYRTIAVYCWE